MHNPCIINENIRIFKTDAFPTFGREFIKNFFFVFYLKAFANGKMF